MPDVSAHALKLFATLQASCPSSAPEDTTLLRSQVATSPWLSSVEAADLDLLLWLSGPEGVTHAAWLGLFKVLQCEGVVLAQMLKQMELQGSQATSAQTRASKQSEAAVVKPQEAVLAPVPHLTADDRLQLKKVFHALDYSHSKRMKWRDFESRFGEFQFRWVLRELEAVAPDEANGLLNKIVTEPKLETLFELVISGTDPSKRKDKHQDVRSFLNTLVDSVSREEAAIQHANTKLAQSSRQIGAEPVNQPTPPGVQRATGEKTSRSSMMSLCCCFGSKDKELLP